MNISKLNAGLVIAIFCFGTVNINADDILIARDPKYFNPLAVSFKWDIKLDKVPLSEQSIQIRYQLYDTKKQKVVWHQKQLVDFKENSFSLYLFITEIDNKVKGPFIRIETIPSREVTRFEVPDSRHSNSILFSGRNEMVAKLSVPQKLFDAKLQMSDTMTAEDEHFFHAYMSADKEKSICNFNVDFYIEFDILDSGIKIEK